MNNEQQWNLKDLRKKIEQFVMVIFLSSAQ